MLSTVERRGKEMIGKTVFKVLVVDDEKIRNKTYMDVLSDKFNVEIINDLGLITKKKVMNFDLLVIDICLSKNVESLTAFKILEDYGLTLPTVLVSGEWIKSNGEPNEFILKVPNYKNVIKVVSWNDFNREGSNKRISEEIFYEFCKNRNIAMINESDKCVILHLSDLQFGGGTTSAACNDNARLVKYLAEKNIVPDFIVITGDIANSGKKEEYQLAKIWIEQLARELWDVNDELDYEHRQKIMIVPGNHDFDISICASDIYHFKFKEKTVDVFEKKDGEIVFTNQKLGFSNFINFAYDLTKDEKWYHYLDNAVGINDRFLNHGIRIINFNSVYKLNSRNCENRFDEFYCDLSKYQSNELKASMKSIEGILNIMITHNPPEDFRPSTVKGDNSWNIFQTLIEDNNISICLYGHTHDTKLPKRLRDNGGDYCKKLLCISAPSVRLAAASRTEDASRGFNVIELNKANGIYNNIVIKNFEMKKAIIEEKNSESFDLK